MAAGDEYGLVTVSALVSIEKVTTPWVVAIAGTSVYTRIPSPRAWRWGQVSLQRHSGTEGTSDRLLAAQWDGLTGDSLRPDPGVLRREEGPRRGHHLQPRDGAELH